MNAIFPNHPNSLAIPQMEAQLGYHFQDQAPLVLALTHSSFAHETAGTSCLWESNERLEFLGDAVLGLVITGYLYEKYPLLSEGKMSAMKSRLVSGGMLGKIAKGLNLGKFLLLGRGEEKLGGRLKKPMLARTLEAMVGAVFLDGGVESAQEVVLRLFQKELDGIHRRMEEYDYKSQLQKVTQNFYGIVPVYELVSQTGPDHGRVFRVRVRVRDQIFAIARGTSKKTAEQRAARLVLRKIEKQHEPGSAGQFHHAGGEEVQGSHRI